MNFITCERSLRSKATLIKLVTQYTVAQYTAETKTRSANRVGRDLALSMQLLTSMRKL